MAASSLVVLSAHTQKRGNLKFYQKSDQFLTYIYFSVVVIATVRTNHIPSLASAVVCQVRNYITVLILRQLLKYMFLEW